MSTNTLSTLSRYKKVMLALLLGVISLLLSPYGIVVLLGEIQIDIPWSLIFPVLVSMSLGWPYGLLSGWAGGAFFPFLLWPEDGWANATTSLVYLGLYTLLGIASDERYFKKARSFPLRIISVIVVYLVVNCCYNYFLFNNMLSLNPAFWNEGSLMHLDLDVLYGFTLKDGINIIAVTLAADTFLRLPYLRKLLGMHVSDEMQANTSIFIMTFFIPVIAWLSFVALGSTLLKGSNALQYEHKYFALLIILTNGFLVSRLLFHYHEKHELEMHLKNKKLQLQNRELEQFAYITSHDLQEPLQTLNTISEMMKKEYTGTLDPKAETYLKFIGQSSQRMRELVRGLLDYARIGKTGEKALLDLNVLVKEVLEDMAARIEEKKAVFEIQHLPTLNVYSTELRQLFQNLISNALKFSRADTLPIIRISVDKNPQHWLFAIEDNGIGMEQDDLDKIFTIFKRLHNRNEYEGIGIGLSHAKKIIALHGGELWVTSQLGQGSIFYFTIPFQRLI